MSTIKEVTHLQKGPRQSNMELARIIAMSIIVIWHFFIHGGMLEHCYASRYYMPLLIWGVNLFILVSGYFLINVNWKSILRLILVVWVFCFISSLIQFLITSDISYWGMFFTVLKYPLSKAPYWFINYYIGLVALSPFINLGLRNLHVSKLRILVIMLTIMEGCSSWLGSAVYNSDGYSLFNFIYLYIIGYYLRVDDAISKISPRIIVIVAVAAMVLNLLLNYWLLDFSSLPKYDSTSYIQLAYIKSMVYNNPFMILFVVCVLLLLSKCSFKSRTVNSIASASIGVYLLQEGYASSSIYTFMRDTYVNCGVWQWGWLCIVLFIAFWALSWIIMRMMSPLVNVTVRMIERHVPGRFLLDVKRW